MKRGLVLALLFWATSVVVGAQTFGPGRPTGVRANSIAMGPLASSRGFGHPGPFRNGAHSHHRFSPTYYYWPYYGYSAYPYDYGDYYGDAYAQPPAAVDPPPPVSDHSFEQARVYPPRPAAPPAAPEEQDPTVLVFRDGHQQEVRNYAIVGQMLWDFSAKGTHKIPLSDLDLETTRKLNDDRGVEFVLPKT